GMKVLEGHEYIGRRLLLKYKSKTISAVCVGYWPKTEQDDENWLVLHQDGDAEDLDKEQIENGFATYKH